MTHADPVTSEAPSWGYVPGLDGLRALAVGLVLLFHVGFVELENGFIGVDVFFVLSGFLVANVVLDEKRRSGRFDVTRFFAKRVRRLLPPALLLIAVVSGVFWLFGSSIELFKGLANARAAVAYHANYHQIAAANDYFGNAGEQSPFLHFWSLSVEEQFYFAFPPFMLAMFWLRSRVGARGPALALVALTVASLAYQLSASGDSLAYYSTFARAYQILAGVTLAYWLTSSRGLAARLRPPAWMGSVCLAALVVLALPTGLAVHWSGVLTTTATLVVLWSLRFPKLLEAKPVVWVGKASYGIYLWHWPVIVLAESRGVTNVWLLLAITVAGTLALAAASYYTIERWCRHGMRAASHRSVIYAGATASLIFWLAISWSASPLSTDSWVQARYTLAVGHSCDADGLDDCRSVPDSKVENGNGNSDDDDEAVVAVLLGDSHAEMYTDLFEAWALKEGVTLFEHSLSGCPWVIGVQASHVSQERAEACLDAQLRDRSALLAAVHPDVVFLVSRAHDVHGPAPQVFGRTSGAVGLPERSATAYHDAIEASVTWMAEQTDAHLVAFESAPISTNATTPLVCLSVGRDDCAYATETPASDRVVESAVGAAGGTFASFKDLLCPGGSPCPASIGGTPVLKDFHHITVEFASQIEDEAVARISASAAVQ